MGIMKFAARKGAIGGTARWVGDRFLESLAVGLIDVENCQTSKGIKKELQKVVEISLESRYPEAYHPFKEEILNVYERIYGPGLAGFTVSILALEADWAKNTLENRNEMLEVIHEELEKKGVGDIMINGQSNKILKIRLSLAPKPKSFKKHSLDLLLKTQWELVVSKARVDEARINPITDKELETAIALTGLKATVFERRLGMYEYHHGNTKEYWIAKYDFEGFLNDNKELMHEYRVWFENAKV